MLPKISVINITFTHITELSNMLIYLLLVQASLLCISECKTSFFLRFMWQNVFSLIKVGMHRIPCSLISFKR